MKNFSDGKKNNSKKHFLKNFFEKEKFDYDKHTDFLNKFNKNSSVKDIFSIKKLNFFGNEVLIFIYFYHKYFLNFLFKI